MIKIKKLLSIFALSIVLFITGCIPTDSKLQKLNTPVITLSDNIVSWEPIENANGYIIYINGIDEINMDSTETSYELSFDQVGIYKIKMRALGDGKNYDDSGYSNIVTYTCEITDRIQLTAPDIRVSKLTVLWEAIENANEYKIYINDKFITSITTPYYQLIGYDDGQNYTIKVIACGNSRYINSPFSNAVTYNSINFLMKVDEIKQKLDHSTSGQIDVDFVGKVVGFDSLGYAHVADETGYIYVRHICDELTLGQNVRISGTAYVYRGSITYPEYTRQIASNNIIVTKYDGEISNVIKPVNLTNDDLNNLDIEANFHGNPVTVTGTVECGSTRYTFYLNDDNGKHIAMIHHYSTNFNNDINDTNKNIFLTLNNKKVTLTGVIYRLYEKENIWTIQCIGLENEVQVLSTRVNTPIISIVDNQLVWDTDINYKEYKIFVNGTYYATTTNAYFDLEELGDGNFKLQVQAISNSDEYEDSILSNTIVYTKNAQLNQVNIFMINDTHGSFADGNTPGVERLSSLINYLTQMNGNYVKIANGDIFQGSYVSSILYGLPFIDALNYMKFDAFVLGNHEFDWGLDKIKIYKDGDYSNGEADFPFLGANIYDKKTNERVPWLDPYTVVEINDVKVGIIGIIGYDLESSILYDNVKDYDFVYPLELIKQYAKELRTELDCDVVIVSNHDYDTELNGEIAKLTGDAKIDAILCGHTHQNEYDTIRRSDGLNIVAVENRDKNQSSTSLILKLDNQFNYESYEFQRYYPSNCDLDPKMASILKKYQEVINEGNRELGTVNNYLSRSTLGMYAVTAMKEEFNVDVAIMNTGGVRATIASGSIKVADVFEVFPFNNAVIITTMKGSALKSLYNTNGDYLYFNQEFDVAYLDNNKNYNVAVIDYVYVSPRYSEFKNTIPQYTNYILRDLVIEFIDRLY